MTAIAQNFRSAKSVLERNVMFAKRFKAALAAGMLESAFWLFGIGLGVGALVDGIDVGGRVVTYGEFVAPGLLAVAAMNGAIFESTFNFFFKLRHAKTFDSMLATPLRMQHVVVGEVSWSVLRSTVYAAGFLALAVAMGLISSWWAILIVPTATLIGVSISAIGIFSVTFMRNWNDFDYVTLVMQFLFMCSATFFPITVFPEWAQILMLATPLYHGVAVCRDLALGMVDLTTVGHLMYMVVVAAVLGRAANRRLEARLLS